MCTESYEFPLKDIICKMLRHNPRLRPECEDILKYIEDNYTGAPAIEHQISEMSMSSQSSRGTLSGDNSIANEANEEQEEMMSAQSANNIPIFLTGRISATLTHIIVAASCPILSFKAKKSQ